MTSKTKIRLTVIAIATFMTISYLYNHTQNTKTLSEVISESDLAIEKVLADRKTVTATSVEPFELTVTSENLDRVKTALTKSEKQIDQLNTQLEQIEKYFTDNHVLESLKHPELLNETQRAELFHAIEVKTKVLERLSEIQIAESNKILAEVRK